MANQLSFTKGVCSHSILCQKLRLRNLETYGIKHLFYQNLFIVSISYLYAPFQLKLCVCGFSGCDNNKNVSNSDITYQFIGKKFHLHLRSSCGIHCRQRNLSTFPNDKSHHYLVTFIRVDLAFV